MEWKKFFKPNLEKILILVIVFTFFPWPRQIYITPGFFTSFLFYGPITLSEILSILLQINNPYGSVLPRLFSNYMVGTYLNFTVVLVLSYLLSCFIAYKTSFFRPTKSKSIITLLILLVSFIIFLILFLPSGYNENALSFNILISLILFSISYITYSFIQKNKTHKL